MKYLILYICVFSSAYSQSLDELIKQAQSGKLVSSSSISIRTSNGVKTVTVKKDGQVVKVFRKKSDFTQEDIEKYPSGYEAFGGVNEAKEKRVQEAIDSLNAYDPNGLDVYNSLKKKDTFVFFLGDNNDLSTAVHEGLHSLDLELRVGNQAAFKLVDGDFISMPIKQTYLRKVVYDSMLDEKEKEDTYAQIYLTGSSGAQGIHMLLEELNAYAHGNTTTLRLSEGNKSNSYFNVGLSRMMYYTLLYLKFNKQKQSNTWKFMKSDKDFKNVLLSLWRQAEEVVGKSCLSDFVRIDTTDLNKIYTDENILFLSDYFDGEEVFDYVKECQIDYAETLDAINLDLNKGIQSLPDSLNLNREVPQPLDSMNKIKSSGSIR